MSAPNNLTIVIGCNLLTSIDRLAYQFHTEFWYHLGKHHPEWKIISFMPRRMSIDRMRNMTAKFAIEQEADYVFFYDDDVLFHPSALQTLIETQLKTSAAVVAGDTRIRAYPFKPMCFTWKDGNLTHYDDYHEHKDKDGLVECSAIGFSLALLDVRQMKEVEPPYFVTGAHNTEDVYYCMRLVEANPDATIILDTNTPTMHLLEQYAITPGNVDEFKVLEEKLYQNTKETNNDRGTNYYERVLETLRRQKSQ